MAAAGRHLAVHTAIGAVRQPACGHSVISAHSARGVGGSAPAAPAGAAVRSLFLLAVLVTAAPALRLPLAGLAPRPPYDSTARDQSTNVVASCSALASSPSSGRRAKGRRQRTASVAFSAYAIRWS